MTITVVEVAAQLEYRVSTPASFIFGVACAATTRQKIRQETVEIDPPGIEFEWCELGEPGHRSLRLRSDVGTLRLNYKATVELSPEIERPPVLDEVDHPFLPRNVLEYLNPSRYCESDRLNRYANKQFGNLTPGYARIEAVCDWVNGHLDYVAGSTNSSSSACDVLIQRAGVCRDYAHVAIAFCRSLGVPARYVSGYAVGLEPPDFHGFFEAFLGESWYLFDATRMAPVTGFVRIGVGRDAADTSVATINGFAQLDSMFVAASHAKDTNIPADPHLAVSTV